MNGNMGQYVPGQTYHSGIGKDQGVDRMPAQDTHLFSDPGDLFWPGEDVQAVVDPATVRMGTCERPVQLLF